MCRAVVPSLFAHGLRLRPRRLQRQSIAAVEIVDQGSLNHALIICLPTTKDGNKTRVKNLTLINDNHDRF